VVILLKKMITAAEPVITVKIVLDEKELQANPWALAWA
jgi:hypothetical protein